MRYGFAERDGTATTGWATQAEAAKKQLQHSAAVLRSSTNLPRSWQAKTNPHLLHPRCPSADFETDTTRRPRRSRTRVLSATGVLERGLREEGSGRDPGAGASPAPDPAAAPRPQPLLCPGLRHLSPAASPPQQPAPRQPPDPGRDSRRSPLPPRSPGPRAAPSASRAGCRAPRPLPQAALTSAGLCRGSPLAAPGPASLCQALPGPAAR